MELTPLELENPEPLHNIQEYDIAKTSYKRMIVSYYFGNCEDARLGEECKQLEKRINMFEIKYGLP